MPQRDYILRLIEQLARAVAAVISRRDAGDLTGAHRLVQNAAGDLLGLSGDDLERLSVDEWRTLLRPTGQLDVERCIVVGSLLDELFRTTGQPIHAERALPLLLEAAPLAAPELRDTLDARLAHLERALECLPADCAKTLALHWESRGKFGRAEDALHELRRVDPIAARAAARAFYDRLAPMNDRVLADGGLPRDELATGLAQFERD
ncbi:MAG: DUF6483 family protein [Acidobacteriota bacterium]